MSQRQAAKALGVSVGTINKDVQELDENRSKTERATKAERRAQREIELAARQTALPEKKYDRISATIPSGSPIASSLRHAVVVRWRR